MTYNCKKYCERVNDYTLYRNQEYIITVKSIKTHACHVVYYCFHGKSSYLQLWEVAVNAVITPMLQSVEKCQNQETGGCEEVLFCLQNSVSIRCILFIFYFTLLGRVFMPQIYEGNFLLALNTCLEYSFMYTYKTFFINNNR